MKWLSALGLVLLLTPLAASQDEREHGKEFREAAEALMCQCGCGATVYSCSMEHCHSAEPIREEIWERLQKGESVASIIETFKNRYGLVILSAPPTSGFHLAAWIVPFVVLLVGAFATRQVLHSWRHQSQTPGEAAPPITDAERARIENELRELH